MRSIHKKYLEIESLANQQECDVLCLTETWCKDYQLQSMNIENYTLATYFNRKFFEHGGTAIYVKNNLDFKVRNDLNKMSFETNCELAAIELKPSKLVIIALYRPEYDMNLFFDILAKLLNKLCKENKQIVIAGDYNLNVLKIDANIRKLDRILRNCNCNWVLNEPTRTETNKRNKTSSTCIDNFIVNFNDCKGYVLGNRLSDHNVIKLELFNHKSPCRKNATYITRIFSKNNLNYFNYIFNKNYVALKGEILLTNDANTRMMILQDAINYCYNIAFPKQIKQVQNKQRKWTTFGIETSKKNLIKMEILQEHDPCEQRKLKIKKYRKILRKTMNGAKKLQYRARIIKAKNKIRESWKIINEQVGQNRQQNKKSTIKSIKNDNGEVITEAKSIASLFNDFFRNIAHKLTSNLEVKPDKCKKYLETSNRPLTSIAFYPLDYEELKKIVCDLKQKSSLDVYDMSTRTLRNIILHNDNLLELLFITINSCLTEGIFPDVLKPGRVIPLFKKGDSTDFGNYRPVCILPTISKILEAVIKSRIVDYFENNKLFTMAQFGFRKGRSTEMAIRKVIYFILESLDSSNKCASIFCDLSKAFDCLRHDILMLKLQYYGFHGAELNMMKTYLENRSQIVSVNDHTSQPGTTSIGVPQGSILGPVLFLIYINDLVNSMPDWTTISLFADDTHVGIKDKSKTNLDIKINNVMNLLRDWFDANGIILNSDKSTVMKYSSRLGVDGNFTSEENVFLGYTIDNTINHKAHIDKICKKMASGNYALFKLKSLLDKKSLISMYYAYIHSIITYAITIWGNSTNINKVLKCQKRSIRIINGLKKRSPARKHFKNDKIMTVISLYIYNSLLEVHEDKEIPRKKDTHPFNTRKKEKRVLPFSRLVKTQKQGRYSKILMYNKLPESITILNYVTLKRKLKCFFERNPFYKVSEYMSMQILESSFLCDNINKIK